MQSINIKFNLTRKGVVIVFLLAFLTAIFGVVYATSSCRVRKELIAEYTETNRECFANIVQYRLTGKEARVLLKFMRELKKRPGASPLEFGDMATVQSINQAYQVCLPRVAPVQQVPQAPQAQQQKQNKKGK